MNVKVKKYFYLLFLLNIIYIAVALWIVYPIAFRDMLQLEVARNSFQAEQILAFWQSQGLMNQVETFLILNLFYIPLYIPLLWCSLQYFTLPTKHEILIRAAKFFSLLLVVAGICDAIENWALLNLVQNGINEWNLHLGYDMAATKFSILLVTILLLIISVAYILLQKLVPEKKKNYFNPKP
ncbi:hypothetical protein [Gynurincola endophyticus]|jgi:hypothetical protein|uniref:hypothetical protein n=1 Tax=Gynurincola endophyticus TaxID=2479004 RepID=UPI000F8DEBF3|nr:hypothetical protein [Gynurincola endophyticus]